MGKGFNNFMSKKAFHPGSYANQKRIQEAELKAEEKRKHDAETLAQYRKEQELFQQRSLVSRESKDKLSLSFMYDAPPGTSDKSDTKGDDDDIPKIKWNKEVKSEAKHTNDDDDDEPRIQLKWKRTEPKSKNHKKPRVKEEKQQPLLIPKDEKPDSTF